jgi:glycerol uptake facilitator-like aquaporin
MNDAVDFGLYWFTLMLINAGLAQAKGRSGWIWFLVSLLIGPLATALIVVWSRVEPRTA